MSAQTFDRAELVNQLKTRAVKHGDFTLASGKKSKIYIDGRLVTLSAEGANHIADGILQYLQQHPEVKAVGGLTMGADPIVGAVLAKAGAWDRGDLSGCLGRKAAKDPGTKVAILDDVATTGGSSLQAVEAVQAAGAEVAVVIVVLDRLQGAAANFAEKGLKFHALTDLRDLGIEPAPV